MTEQKHSNFEIALPAESSLADLMANSDALNSAIDRLEAAARSTVTDTSTSKGRDAIRALAAKIAKSKVALDKAGLASTEDLRAKVTETNARRTIAKERLSALQVEMRKPLTDWEEAEELRKEAMAQRLAGIDKGSVDLSSTSEQIKAAISKISAIPMDETWGDQITQAEYLKGDALDHFAALLPIAEKREAEARELEELRALRAEQERKDAEIAAKELQEAQEREAAETHKRNAEAQRIAAENAAQAERERAEREAIEEKARHAREIEQAELDRIAAERRHAEELENAAAAERKRVEDERVAAAAEEARQLSNTRRANRIKAEIQAAIGAMKDQSPEAIATAIYAGQIPHVKVTV